MTYVIRTDVPLNSKVACLLAVKDGSAILADVIKLLVDKAKYYYEKQWINFFDGQFTLWYFSFLGYWSISILGGVLSLKK